MTGLFLHTMRDAADLIERRLGVRVTALSRFEHGVVNAVYFAILPHGRECVLRVSPQEDRDHVALELWAFERCRAVQVVVPTILAHDLNPTDFPEPFIITERVVGVLGDSAELTLSELYAAYEDLGQRVARLHTIVVPGYGELRREGDGFVGPFTSWWDRLRSELNGYERALLHHTRDGRAGHDGRGIAKLHEVRARFEAHRALFDLGAAALVHGDLQGKNFLVHGGKVAAMLDFECAEAGDPVMDFRVFRYWDGKRDALTDAMLRGYCSAGGGTAISSGTGPETAFWTKLGLYELLYALLRLTQFYKREDHARIEDTFRRIDRIERDLNRH